MTTVLSRPVGCAVLALALAVPLRAAAAAPAPELEIHPGDHICYIGNTLADRMQHDGWLETFLYSRFPKQNLVIRDLGFSGDEVGGSPTIPNSTSASAPPGSAAPTSG